MASSWQRKEAEGTPAKTITDADYTDDIAILANTPNQAETLLHSLERAAAGIGLYVNAHKMEYMCYNQTGDISTLEGTPLKLVDKFTYLGSSVSSTEKDIDTKLTKAWTAINRLSIIWKSDQTDKMKRSFFQAAVTSILLYGCTTWTLTKRLEKKLDGNYTGMLRAILDKSWWQHLTRHQLYGQAYIDWIVSQLNKLALHSYLAKSQFKEKKGGNWCYRSFVPGGFCWQLNIFSLRWDPEFSLEYLTVYFTSSGTLLQAWKCNAKSMFFLFCWVTINRM